MFLISADFIEFHGFQLYAVSVLGRLGMVSLKVHFIVGLNFAPWWCRGF